MSSQEGNNNSQINDYDMSMIMHKLAIPVMNLNISLRSIKYLIKAGIKNVGTILLCSSEDLLNIKNLGADGAYEVIDLMNAMGFNFPLSESQKEKVKQEMVLRGFENVSVKKEEVDFKRQTLLEELHSLIEQKRKLDEESRKLEIRIEEITNELDNEKDKPKKR